MLLAVWSASAFLLEVPSGAWADLLDRRRLLIASGLVYASAFGVWLAWPTFWGFLLGFVLWSLSDAMHSGTWEAYLFDQLRARGVNARYAQVKARSESVALLVMAGAIAAAAPLHQAGGYALVGALSLGVAVVHVGVALRLPPPVPHGIPPEEARADAHPTSPRVVTPPAEPATAEEVGHPKGSPGLRAWGRTLRAGLDLARARGPVRRVLVGYAAIVTLVGFDEYFPLVLAEDGSSVGRVALVMAGIVLLEALGTALSDRVAVLTGWRHAALVVTAGVLLGVGAWGAGWSGALALGIGYAVASSLYLADDARLQHSLAEDSRTRATVTSVASVAGELGFLVTLAAVGLLTLHHDLTSVMTWTVLALTLPAAALAWRLPAGAPPTTASDHPPAEDL